MWWLAAMFSLPLVVATCSDDDPVESTDEDADAGGGGDVGEEPDIADDNGVDQGEEDTGGTPDVTVDTAGEPDEGPEPCEPGGETFDLTGTFAVEAEIRANAIIDVEGSAYFLMTIEQTGTTVSETTQTCLLVIPSVPEVAEVTIPPALETLIREQVHESTGDYLSGTEACALYEPPTQTIVLGAELDDPVDDPLPTADDQSTAIDQDDDSNPGVTLDADVLLCPEGTEQLYVAMRTVVSLTGEIRDSNSFTGLVDVDIEQEILAMSDDCLSDANAIQIVIQPGSAFLAKRVDGANGTDDLDTNDDDVVDCSELENVLETLFADE